MATKFKSGADVNPFYRASQKTIDMIESATALDFASSVPYLKITQVSPYTGEELEKPPLMLDFVSPPGFGRPNNGYFLERPLVSLDSITTKSEAMYGMSYYRHVDIAVIVHSPATVFFGDDKLSTFRAMMHEGNSFKIQYGWKGSTKNNLLNGIGFFDETSGYSIPSIKTIRINITSWTCSLGDDGQMRVNLKCIEDGELAFREAKLSKFLDLSKIETSRRKENKRPRANLAQADRDADVAQDVLATLSKIETITIKPYGTFYKFVDILDALVAPIVEKTCMTLGYKKVDLYLGNYANDCKKSAKNLGAREYASKSIGETLISADALKKSLGMMHAAGEGLTVSNFVENCTRMINENTLWQDEREDRRSPEIFVGTSTRSVDGGLGFILFFADRSLSTIKGDDFVREDRLDPESQTKEQIFNKLRQNGIPFIKIGSAGSFVKSANFDCQLDDQLRTALVDNSLKARKSKVQMTSQPDSKGREGRSDPESYTFFTSMAAELTMIGNFIFNWGQTVWVDFFDVFPISGLYTIIGYEESVSSAGFVTKIKINTDGTDPLNTRGKKSLATLHQEDFDKQKAKEELAKKASKASKNKK